MHSRLVIHRLQREGWVLARVAGSHHQFVHAGKPGKRVTVTHPKKNIPLGTLRSIMRQAGWETL